MSTNIDNANNRNNSGSERLFEISRTCLIRVGIVGVVCFGDLVHEVFSLCGRARMRV